MASVIRLVSVFLFSLLVLSACHGHGTAELPPLQEQPRDMESESSSISFTLPTPCPVEPNKACAQPFYNLTAMSGAVRFSSQATVGLNDAGEVLGGTVANNVRRTALFNPFQISLSGYLAHGVTQLGTVNANEVALSDLWSPSGTVNKIPWATATESYSTPPSCTNGPTIDQAVLWHGGSFVALPPAAQCTANDLVVSFANAVDIQGDVLGIIYDPLNLPPECFGANPTEGACGYVWGNGAPSVVLAGTCDTDETTCQPLSLTTITGNPGPGLLVGADKFDFNSFTGTPFLLNTTTGVVSTPQYFPYALSPYFLVGDGAVQIGAGAQRINQGTLGPAYALSANPINPTTFVNYSGTILGCCANNASFIARRVNGANVIHTAQSELGQFLPTGDTVGQFNGFNNRNQVLASINQPGSAGVIQGLILTHRDAIDVSVETLTSTQLLHLAYLGYDTVVQEIYGPQTGPVSAARINLPELERLGFRAPVYVFPNFRAAYAEDPVNGRGGAAQMTAALHALPAGAINLSSTSFIALDAEVSCFDGVTIQFSPTRKCTGNYNPAITRAFRIKVLRQAIAAARPLNIPIVMYTRPADWNVLVGLNTRGGQFSTCPLWETKADNDSDLAYDSAGIGSPNATPFTGLGVWSQRLGKQYETNLPLYGTDVLGLQGFTAIPGLNVDAFDWRLFGVRTPCVTGSSLTKAI